MQDGKVVTTNLRSGSSKILEVEYFIHNHNCDTDCDTHNCYQERYIYKNKANLLDAICKISCQLLGLLECI